MSFSNNTEHFNLPQYIASDVPSWLVDINNAFEDIDTALYANQTVGNSAQATATNALNVANSSDIIAKNVQSALNNWHTATVSSTTASSIASINLTIRCNSSLKLLSIIGTLTFTGSSSIAQNTVISPLGQNFACDRTTIPRALVTTTGSTDLQSIGGFIGIDGSGNLIWAGNTTTPLATRTYHYIGQLVYSGATTD